MKINKHACCLPRAGKEKHTRGWERIQKISMLTVSISTSFPVHSEKYAQLIFQKNSIHVNVVDVLKAVKIRTEMERFKGELE